MDKHPLGLQTDVQKLYDIVYVSMDNVLEIHGQ